MEDDIVEMEDDIVGGLQEVDMLHVVMTMVEDTLLRVDMMDVLVREDQEVEEDIVEMVEDIVGGLQEVDMLHVVMTMAEDIVNHVQISIVVMLDIMLIHREENNTICEYSDIYYNLGIVLDSYFYAKKNPHRTYSSSISYCKKTNMDAKSQITSFASPI